MTTAERLVRQACKARLQELAMEERTAVEAVPEEIPFARLPRKLQALIIEKRQITHREQEIDKALTNAGYYAYRCQPNKPAPREGAQKERQAVRAREARRREAVERLQTATAIAVIGRTPEEARTALQRLQRELARV